MTTYYVSLNNCLIGKCIEVKAPNEDIVREWCFHNLGKMWCSVYTENEEMIVIGTEVLH